VLGLAEAVVGGRFRHDDEQILFLRFAVGEVRLLGRHRHAEDRHRAMAAVLSIHGDDSELRIEELGLRRPGRAIGRGGRQGAAGQQLLPVENLNDAVFADAVRQ